MNSEEIRDALNSMENSSVSGEDFSPDEDEYIPDSGSDTRSDDSIDEDLDVSATNVNNTADEEQTETTTAWTSPATGETLKNFEEFTNPPQVLQYDAGIDLADQVASYFSPFRKTIRWFHKVAFDVLLNTAVINAYILHNENNPKMQISDFRQSIILFMSGKDSASIARSPSQEKHFLITSTEATKDGRRKRHRCGMCYSELKTTSSSSVARKKAKLVATYCAQCRRSPYLCLKHFQQLH